MPIIVAGDPSRFPTHCLSRNADYDQQGGGDAKWLDQLGSFMATVAAGSAYKLLGAHDLGLSNDYMAEKMPPVLTGLLDGELAWRRASELGELHMFFRPKTDPSKAAAA